MVGPQNAVDDRPVILAADDDPAAAGMLSAELERRYGRDYRIVTSGSGAAAVADLEVMQRAGDRVALVLADVWMPGLTGTEVLEHAHRLHPGAKRGLLISWGEWAHEPTADAVRAGMALGHFDYYVLKPWKSPDEYFHRTVCEFLSEWWRAETSTPHEVTLVADPWSARTHDLRNLLARNGVPHVFHPLDSPDGERLLEEHGRAEHREPMVIMLDGRVLVDPSNTELARGYGVATDLAGTDEFDVVIVGAGPAGLAAAVYATSEGLRTLVIECEAIGGQAGSSSRIRNYLGFARGISGAELAQRAYQQAWVFGTRFLLMRETVDLRVDGSWRVVTTADGSEIRGRVAILAMGVTYRRLGVESLEALEGTSVFYGASPVEAARFTGGQVYLVGGGNSAGQAAIHLGKYAARVTVVVRGTDLAATMSQYLRDEIAATPNIAVRRGTEVTGGAGDHHLESLTLHDRAGSTDETVPADALFVLIGAEPRTEWLPADVDRDEHGFVLTGADVDSERGAPAGGGRPRLRFETGMPGVFAIGDLRSGSVKRVAAAVGEGSIAIQDVAEYLATVRP